MSNTSGPKKGNSKYLAAYASNSIHKQIILLIQPQPPHMRSLKALENHRYREFYKTKTVVRVKVFVIDVSGRNISQKTRGEIPNDS